MAMKRLRLSTGTSASGSGPGGTVTTDDIRAKLTEIRSEMEATGEKARTTMTYVAVGAVIAAVGLAFLLGRRKGRRRSTVVEIRRV